MDALKFEIIDKHYQFFTKFKHKRILISYGGAGSGKSENFARYAVLRLLNETGKRWLMARKTNPSARLSVMTQIENLLRMLNIKFTENKSDQIIRVNGNEIIFRGLDDPEKIKSIDFNYIWMEEATEFTRGDYDQLNLRLRKVNLDSNNQIVLTFNPVSTSNWVYSTFFEKKWDWIKANLPENEWLELDEDTAVMRSNYKLNRFLSPDYIKAIEKYKDTDFEWYRVYALGDFGAPQTKIFNNYQKIAEEYMPKDKEYDEIIWGIDFGYATPTAIVKLGILNKDEIYVLDEFKKERITNDELKDILTEMMGPEHIKDYIYADSAEPNRIEELYLAGFNIYPSDKKIKEGIDFLRQKKIFISERCVQTYKEFGKYEWKKDKEGNILDEPRKLSSIHILDALRYAVVTHLKKPDFVML